MYAKYLTKMGLYTKIDKEIDKYYEIVPMNKSISKQNFYLKVLVLLLSNFNVFGIIRRYIPPIHSSIIFSLR